MLKKLTLLVTALFLACGTYTDTPAYSIGKYRVPQNCGHDPILIEVHNLNNTATVNWITGDFDSRTQWNHWDYVDRSVMRSSNFLGSRVGANSGGQYTGRSVTFDVICRTRHGQKANFFLDLTNGRSGGYPVILNIPVDDDTRKIVLRIQPNLRSSTGSVF